jgi:hypothetical protein
MDMESVLCEMGSEFIGVYAKNLPKETINVSCLYVCPSVRVEQSDSNFADSREISYMWLLLIVDSD